MKELDLEPLVGIAIHLDQEARDVNGREVALLVIEKGAAEASPASLEKRLRDLGTHGDRAGLSRSGIPGVTWKLRERLDEERDHPEVRALIARLLDEAQELGERIGRLRRRISDLEMVLVGAVKDLEGQSLDSRILRLAGDGSRNMTAGEIHKVVEKDHQAIADAIATWKLTHGVGAVISIRSSSTREEVEQALRRLERTGHAGRIGLRFGPGRWKVQRTAEESRLRA